MNTPCPVCGNSLEANDKFCRVCGKQTAGVPASPAIPAPPARPAETSGKAVISLVCGLLFFVPMAFIAAIVFGHLSLSEIKRSAGRLTGEGMAIAGLVLGYIWIAGIPVFLIIAAIAIPNVLRARIAANEASAAGGVRTLMVAEVSYAANHPDEGYTCSLSALEQAGLISGKLASGQRNGYAFEFSTCAPGAEGGPNSKYQIVAYPLTLNQTGRKAFCGDESGALKTDIEGSAKKCLESGSDT